MIHDARRVEAYWRALQFVAPDAVVVDIGTGLGLFAFLACQAGARKVYAIESDEVIAVARQLAAGNGYEERIEFIEEISSNVTLPEQADVIISDLGGAIPFFGQHVPSIVDARKRFLKPNGVLLPKYDTVWAAVVNAPAVHQKIRPAIDPALELDMRLAWNMAANISSNTTFKEAQLATEPRVVANLDYYQIEDANVHAKINWDVTRSGYGHGINLWFERTLADGVFFSTRPGNPETVYGALFLPWPEPVQLNESDFVELEIRADYQKDEYIWSWNTRVSSATQLKYTFRQSDFFGTPRSPARLRKQRPIHVPTLNDVGRTDRLVLSLIDGKKSIKEIAVELQHQFPKRFATSEQAIGYVADFSRKYSL